jgi:sugar lactone lactonase YvrE
MTKTAGLRSIVSIAAGLSAWLVAGAFVAAAPPGTPQTPTVIVSFDPALAQLPESMTSDKDGNLFASNLSGAIQKIDPQAGTFVTVATVPLPDGAALTGIKIGPDGLIYVASASFSPDPDGAFLWRVNASSGAVEQFAHLDKNGFPNDFVFQDDGSIILTDPFLAQLWKIDTAGNASVFLADPLFAGDPNAPAFGIHAFGIDGIAWDHNKRNLIVSTVDFGRVMRIPMDCEGTPAIEIIVEDPALKGVDGIAIDRRGTIWCAVNTQDRIATVAKGGAISVIAQGAPLDGPSSFAFGTGKHDKQTLYIANFAIGRFLSGQTAHPGILSIPAPVPGLPLP